MPFLRKLFYATVHTGLIKSWSCKVDSMFIEMTTYWLTDHSPLTGDQSPSILNMSLG